MMAALSLLPHLALMLVVAPVLAGLTGTGHPAQPWRDLGRQFRKPGLWPDGAFLFGSAPAASLGASLAAALLAPSFTLGMATAPLADLVLLAGLFAFAEAASVLAGLDAQTGFAALSAQRRAVLLAAAAPGVFVLILLVAAACGTSNLDAASAALREAAPGWHFVLPCIAAVLLFLAADAPPDDAWAGRDLALLRFAAQLRRVTAFSVLAALALPFGLAPAGAGPDAWVIGAACWAVKMAGLGAVAAALGRLRAGLRADQAPELAALGLLLALLAAALFFAGQRAA